MQPPPFALQDNLWWTARAKLVSWEGFLARDGAYGSRRSSFPSDGSVTVCFAPEGRDCEPLLPSELALIRWFFEHEPGVSDSLQRALVEAYPDLRDQYECEADEESPLPETRDIDDLKQVVGLHSVNIHQVSRSGVPYIGFELGCNWDEEHGLGVLMHGTQVVKIGGADTAILLWLAERHARAGAGDA